MFDVTVFDLDQYLLRATHRRVRRYADRYIQNIAERSENSTRSTCNWSTERSVLSAATSIAGSVDLRAAPRISVTFHTILVAEAFDLWRYLKEIGKGNFGKANAFRSS